MWYFFFLFFLLNTPSVNYNIYWRNKDSICYAVVSVKISRTITTMAKFTHFVIRWCLEVNCFYKLSLAKKRGKKFQQYKFYHWLMKIKLNQLLNQKATKNQVLELSTLFLDDGGQINILSTFTWLQWEDNYRF